MKNFKYPDSIILGAFPNISNDERKLLEDKYLDFLSDEQAAVAVHKDGPLMTVAGPGSGKSESMVRRAAILIDFHKVNPENIALTTFTEKAADSLLKKIKQHVQSPEVIEKLTIGTIHSFCLNLLEDFGVKYGLFKRSIRVLDEHRLSLFVYSRFKDLGLKDFFGKPNPRNVKLMIGLYSAIQEKGAKIPELLKFCEENDASENLEIALKTFPIYKKLLEDNNAVDFSSILTRTMDLLHISEAKIEIQNKFKFLIIDEYQDTNPLQDEILRSILSEDNNIAIIGDDDQSIYRFRGATVSNFLNFPDNYPNTEVRKISHNRRSTPEIVNFSRLIVGKIPKAATTEKDIFTENNSFEDIVFHEYETNQDEIIGIVDKIQSLKDKGLIANWSDVAILSYSISSLYSDLKVEFDARGIPLVTKGDKSYLDEPSVQSLISIIGFLTKKKGSITDFKRLSWPIFNVLNPKTEDFILGFTNEKDIIELSENDLEIKSKDDKNRILSLINFRKEILGSNYSSKTYSDLLDLVFQVLTKCETVKFLETQPGISSDDIMNQIGKFTQLLSDYSNETGKRSFSDFNSFISYIIKGTIDTPVNDDIEDAVILQTIHQSKGLEYPVVFMPGLTDLRFPGNQKDNTDFPEVESFYNYWKPNPDIENRDIDFRRLFYVAVTRAEKLVYPSFFKKKKNKAKVSRFVNELITEDNIPVVQEHPIPSTEITTNSIKRKDKLKISSSHLQYYIYCPTRYKYSLKHNIQAPHRGYFSFGSNLHSMIEELTNTVRTDELDKISPELRNQIFKNNWSMFGFENISAAERQMENARKYFDNFCDTHVPLMKNIEVSEKKFTLEEDNFILTGKIDAIVEDTNNLLVVDFKTGKRDKFKKEPEYTFVKNQANIYLEAIDRLGYQGDSSFHLHFLGEDQANEEEYKFPFEVTKDSRGEVLDLLGETVDRINAKDFSPINEETRLKRCSQCEYRKVCPYKIIDSKIKQVS